MKRIKINRKQADELVKEVLDYKQYFYNCPTLIIETNINEGDIRYFVKHNFEHKGKILTRIVPMSIKQYLNFLKKGLELNGYEIVKTYPVIVEQNVSYGAIGKYLLNRNKRPNKKAKKLRIR